MGRRKIQHVGEMLGEILIKAELPKRNGIRQYLFECQICGKQKRVSHSQYNQGSWNLCEHDAI